MKRLNYFVGLSILGALILAVVAIVTASAEAPLIERVLLDADYPETACEFELQGHIYGYARNITFYDKDGAIKARESGYGGMSATITNELNGNTITLHNSENFLFTMNEENGQILGSITGLVWGGSVPGYGRVAGRSGRVVALCHWEGSWIICDERLSLSGMEFNNLDAFCNYMQNGK